MIAKAYGKINLTLEIIDKLPDGYHEIKSVFQRISIYDEIETEKSPTMNIEFNIDVSSFETTVHKAVNLFLQKSKLKTNLHVFVKKNIPIGAGLGGGSSDAATTLQLLNSLFGGPLSSSDLFRIGEEIGSDVLFFLNGSTAFVEGRGNIVYPLNNLTGIYFLIVFPPFLVSTAEAYYEFDKFGKFSKGNYSKETLQAIEKKESFSKIEQFIYNDFELLYRLKDERFNGLFNTIESATNLPFHLTGSGSSIFSANENLDMLISKQKIIEKLGFKTCIAETI
jgi:4-diphosphocytidyl-2-C-methyl-D-erythritol kinase